MRILLREVEKGGPREMFYLAREYMYRKDYQTSAEWYEKCVQLDRFQPELCEAYFQLANCYWQLQRGEEARDTNLKAIKGNPNFKEALIFQGTMSWEKQREVWNKFAEIATNENVLFVRSKE